MMTVKITDLAAWCNVSFTDNYSNPLYYAKHLFMDDKEITDIVIPEGVTSIDEYAFFGWSGLTSIIIPNSVTLIRANAFSGCDGLTSISIGRGVIAIGSRAFSDCSSLKDVYCYAKDVPIAKNYAFYDSRYDYYDSSIQNATLYVRENLIESYKTTEPWSRFGNIIELEDTEIDPDPDPVPTPTPEYVHGDVNGDGVVNGTDIQAVINLIVAGEYDAKADVNEDGIVNGTDIQEVINIIVGGE